MVTDNKPLTIYRASAGSGKTFTLAIEYIKLLINNPYCYNSILAVTFTNKATEEMKHRILSQLYGIWKGLDDSDTYTRVILNDLNIPVSKIEENAGIALKLLIHNYSYFRIETIDSFFQNILRNLARELDLTANLRLELSDYQIEELAVNELIEELDSKNEILQLIISYINENISEDKSWNVINHIKSFGKTIFKDFYKEQCELLNETTIKGFFNKYIKTITYEREEAKKDIEEAVDTFFLTLETEGLSVNDLANKQQGVGGFFQKAKYNILEANIGKRVIECLHEPDKWYSKTCPQKERIHELATSIFIPLLQTIIKERVRYKSAELTLRHLYQLRLLTAIEEKVRELNTTAGRFLLSDTQHLLNSLIGADDSPFIFEKIGVQLKHIMIDEFQDTSIIQWKNFKILLLECMSYKETSNLIVGDVKQSIYRWRSGDWQLLNNISEQFPHPEYQLEINTLKTNYRSQRNVVLFNNAFFTAATEIESKNIDSICQQQNSEYSLQLKSAYKDVCQNVPNSHSDEGFIHTKLLPKEKYEEHVLDEIIGFINEILDKGFSEDSIAIIVRNNKYIPMIAEHISNNIPDIRIVSDEAFRLDASIAVNIIILALRLLSTPNDILTKTTLIKAYQQHILGHNKSDYNYMAEKNNISTLLPTEYTDNFETLRAMPLYDLTERLQTIFNIKSISGQSAYLSVFYDNINSFAQDNIPCIEFFLDEWNNNICNKTIQSSELTGIRIISIHKSKGLEYENVILPFCDWQIEKVHGNILWCKPESHPYNKLPLIPVDYSKNLVGSIFEKDYFYEFLQNRVDNLNLLYVAFTRAIRNLFIIGKREAINSRSSLVQACLPIIYRTLDGAKYVDNENKELPLELQFGTFSKVYNHKDKDKKSNNVFTQRPEVHNICFESCLERPKFRQSNQSRSFIDDKEGDDEQDYITIGRILHAVFSKIKTTDDINGALKQLELDGIINNSEIKGIKSMLKKRLADAHVTEWFSDKWKLFNECTILSIDNNTGAVKERRPDRVMTDGKKVIVVDFKFGKPHDEYYAQIREYMKLISDMGYNNVEGFLWFVYSNKIEMV